MKEKMIYRDLNHALRYLKKQVTASLPYALQKCPKLSSPEAVFNWLKARTTYKHDPRGVELFQQVETLLTENNFHNIRGAGDCDCFTIAALSLLLANGFTDCGIVLAGRSPRTAVHIWAYCNYQGRRVNLDLTNKYFNQTRHYPYTQYIPYVLNQKEKTMLLQLAEGTRKRGAVSVQSHKRRFPLHEGYQGQAKGLNPNASRAFPYVYLPKSRVQVREDVFDGMSAGEFQNMCLSEGVDVGEIVELSAKRAERKAARQEKKAARVEKRQVKRETKQAAKIEKKANSPRAIRQVSKADARAVKAEAKANRPRMSGEDKTKLIKGFANFGTNLVSGFTGQRIAPLFPDQQGGAFTPQQLIPTMTPEEFKQQQQQGSGYNQPISFMDKTLDIFGMEISAPVALVGGTILAGLAYKALQ